MIRLSEIFRPKSGAYAFFLSIVIWGIGIGCYAAVLNNYLVEIHSFNELERGWLEFFRELPGLLLVVFLAFLSRFSDWRILRIGTLISMIAVLSLLLPANRFFLIFIITIFSVGEHLIMPIRSAIAVQVARPDKTGVSLGLLTSTMNAGTILGSILVALIFWIGLHLFHCTDRNMLYIIVWIVVFFLMIASLLTTFSPNAPNHPSRRPRLYFRRKFSCFYILELFYGARKQIFLTFAPYVLIRIYGLSTVGVAILMGISALVNMIGGPWIGRLTDRFGYRTIMIFDTLILFWVCLAYGFADNLFPMKIAFWVVCVNYLLDALISTASLATSIYVKTIAEHHDEFTSTLSTGISINHLISIIIAPVGGWVWMRFGVGYLFLFAAVMALANSFFAWTLPRSNRSK